MDLNFNSPVIEAVFIERVNRFVAQVEYQGRIEVAHVLSTGRMKELLVPGNSIYLEHASKKGRKTNYDLIAVSYNGRIVSIDATLPNRLLAKLFRERRIKEFSSFTQVRTEVTRGNSRLDFCLSDEDEQLWLEVKSVTLVENGVALFPDAPSQRAVKHIEELVRIKQEGKRAGIIFVVQRDDALRFSPNKTADPSFAKAVAYGKREGLEFYAYNCRVNKEGVSLDKPIPLDLTPN
jgi:sugar fermentation stimulation protein A